MSHEIFPVIHEGYLFCTVPDYPGRLRGGNISGHIKGFSR